jgi:hypothetical protein
MKTIYAAIAYLLIVNSYGQNVPLERLNASKIDNSILFRLENIDGNKTLTYEIDTRDKALEEKNTSRSHQVEGNKLSLASTGTSFNILFDFFNPLRYSYKINHEENIDPTTIAYESFYNYVLGIAQKINANADLTTLKSVEVSQTIQDDREVFQDFPNKIQEFISDETIRNNRPNRDTTVINTSTRTITTIKTSELLDWVLWYYKTSPNLRPPSKKSVEDLLKEIKEIEKVIYGTVPDQTIIDSKKGNKLYYETYLIQLFEDLRKTDSFEEFSQMLSVIKGGIAKLKSYNKKLNEFHASMKNVVLVDSKAEAFDSYFILYTRHKINVYSDKIGTLIKNRDDLLTKFEKLLEEIDSKYIVTRSSPITTKPYIVKTKLGSTEKVDIVITENKYSVENGAVKKEETKLYNFVLNVYEFTSVIAEFGLGTIVFPTVISDTYLSNNGVVTKSEINKLFYTPAAALNLVPNIGKGQAFWMIQFAVGSSINTPVIGVGTGVRIYNVRNSTFRNFSITGGIVGCFTKQLSKFSEGSNATQAELDNDLQFSPTFKPYIGIQINF